MSVIITCTSPCTAHWRGVLRHNRHHRSLRSKFQLTSAHFRNLLQSEHKISNQKIIHTPLSAGVADKEMRCYEFSMIHDQQTRHICLGIWPKVQTSAFIRKSSPKWRRAPIPIQVSIANTLPVDSIPKLLACCRFPSSDGIFHIAVSHEKCQLPSKNEAAPALTRKNLARCRNAHRRKAGPKRL